MSTLFGQDDYRRILRDELAARCQANPRYSQRAFARDLRVAPHRLSEVLGGKQGLSRPVAEQMAQRLGLNAKERGYFCDLVESKHARSPVKRKLAAVRLESLKRDTASRRLADDVFQMISDWHHFAILELASLKGFVADEASVGKSLGLKSAQVETAVTRLVELGLLERKSGRLKPTNASDVVPGGAPSEAIRNFHAQVLDKARHALFTSGVAEREFMTAFVGVPKGSLNAAKREIRAFIQSFGDKVRGRKPGERLYALGIQYFPLTEGET